MYIYPTKCSIVANSLLGKGQLVFQGDHFKNDKLIFYNKIYLFAIKIIKMISFGVFEVRTIEVKDISGSTYHINRKSVFLWLTKHHSQFKNVNYKDIDGVNIWHHLHDTLREKSSEQLVKIASKQSELESYKQLQRDRIKRKPRDWSLAEQQLDNKIEKLEQEIRVLLKRL